MPSIPSDVQRLLWDVDIDRIDLAQHGDFVMQRVMSRGGRAAMRWLVANFERSRIADFVARRGDRLSARDRAYWRLVSGLPPEASPPGGGRPSWLP